MNNFWDKVIGGIDEKYINDTVSLHVEKAFAETELVPVVIEMPPPVSKKTLVIRTGLKIAAALAVVIGIGAVLRANDISISEMWAARPSQTTASDMSPSTETTTSEAENVYTTTVESDPAITTTSVLPYNTTVPSTLTEPTTYYFDDSETAMTTTSVIGGQQPIAITGYVLEAPEENYLADYDLENNPPRILYARDTYCVFLMEGGVICYYDANMEQLSGLYDISDRLAKTGYDYDISTVQVSVYLDTNGVPVFVVNIKYSDGSGYDSYTVEFGYYTAALSPISDPSFFDNLMPYEGITLSQQYSTDGFRAEFDAGYTTGYAFLRDGGNEGMRGAYRLEIIYNTERDGAEVSIPFSDPEYIPVAETESEYPALELLGNYYTGEDGLLHVSDEEWQVSDDYELFRKFFFGVWNEQMPTIIDDSERTEFADVNRFFKDFYKVSDNVLAFTTGGSAGGMLYWIDMYNPDMLFYTYGSPGDSPNGIACDEFGDPEVWGLQKSGEVVVDASGAELTNGYLSVFRLREIAKEHGIDYSMLVDFEFEAEDGTKYHDDRYYFYSMYLVSESEDRIELKTSAGNLDNYAGVIKHTMVTVVIEKVDEEWVRTITESEPNPAGNYAEKINGTAIFGYNGTDYYADSMAGDIFIMDDEGNIIREEYYNSRYYPSALNLDKIVTGVTNLNQLTEISPEIYTHYDTSLTYYDIGFGMTAAVKSYDFDTNGMVSGIEPLMEKYPEDWFYKIYTFSSEEHIPEHTEVFIDKNAERMDIDFLTDEQDYVFFNALYIMSGYELNPELSFEIPEGTDRLYEGWYVSDISYYDYWYNFFTAFGSEYRADEMADKFGFRCVNGRLAWKGYEPNPVYEDCTIVEFELIEKAENKVRFKAIVVYEGGVEKEYEYELESYDGTNWHMSEFELWDRP